jgi:hypothetical protein
MAPVAKNRMFHPSFRAIPNRLVAANPYEVKAFNSIEAHDFGQSNHPILRNAFQMLDDPAEYA